MRRYSVSIPAGSLPDIGSSAWNPASTTTLQKINEVKNQALRVITGATKSTPIVEMEKVVDLINTATSLKRRNSSACQITQRNKV
jgi:hypothetical protein